MCTCARVRARVCARARGESILNRPRCINRSAVHQHLQLALVILNVFLRTLSQEIHRYVLMWLTWLKHERIKGNEGRKIFSFCLKDRGLAVFHWSRRGVNRSNSNADHWLWIFNSCSVEMCPDVRGLWPGIFFRRRGGGGGCRVCEHHLWISICPPQVNIPHSMGPQLCRLSNIPIPRSTLGGS